MSLHALPTRERGESGFNRIYAHNPGTAVISNETVSNGLDGLFKQIQSPFRPRDAPYAAPKSRLRLEPALEFGPSQQS